MEDKFIKIIDEIFELMENEECKSYVYRDDVLYIIDKERGIDFKAKLGNNNFYFKNNNTGEIFIFTQKYLNDNVIIQNVLKDNGVSRCFYSYLKNDSFVKLITLMKKDNNEDLIYENTDLTGKDRHALIRYANENMTLNNAKIVKSEDFITEDGFSIEENDDDELDYDEKEENIDDIFKDVYFMPEGEEYDYEEYSEEYEEKYDDESNEFDIVKDENKSILEHFENLSVADFHDIISEGIDNFENGDNEDQKDDVEMILEYYEPINIRINGEMIEDKEKILIASDLDVITEEINLQSDFLSEGAYNLKMLIKELQKNMNEIKNGIFEEENGHNVARDNGYNFFEGFDGSNLEK